MLLSLFMNEMTLSLICFWNMNIFGIFLEIYSGESPILIFSIIITNIDRESLSCLAQIWSFQLTFKCELGAGSTYQASSKFIFLLKLIVIFVFIILVAT